jgi:protein-tyrosine phosphatase
VPNVRDRGGLRTADGRLTRYREIVRSDSPARLTAAGWSAPYAYNILTIVTLDTKGMTEEELQITLPYLDLAVVKVEIEDISDQEFQMKWAATELRSTPLYYPGVLQRWPEETRRCNFFDRPGSTRRRSVPLRARA